MDKLKITLIWIAGMALIFFMGYSLEIMDHEIWQYWVFIVMPSMILGVFIGNLLFKSSNL